MDFVTDQLAISDAQAVRRLDPEKHEFDEVVTLGYLNEFGYERPKASTTHDGFVFPDGEHDYLEFKAAVEYVVNALNEGNTVLVHCQAGVSRSVAITTVALATVTSLSLQEAFDCVEAVRPNANPHPELRESMERYTGEALAFEPPVYDDYTQS